MKKFKIALLAIAASAVVFTGCGKDDLSYASDSDVVETIASNPLDDYSTPNENVVVDDTIPPKEGMVRSKLTNEWIPEELYSQRPLAVMTSNEIAAIQHYAL